MTLSIFSLFMALSINSTTIECHYAEFHYDECRVFKCYVECLYAECHYAECHNAECRYTARHYAECHHAECHYAECRTVTEITLFFSEISKTKFQCINEVQIFSQKHPLIFMEIFIKKTHFELKCHKISFAPVVS
jgi:hypothetical protein